MKRREIIQFQTAEAALVALKKADTAPASQEKYRPS